MPLSINSIFPRVTRKEVESFVFTPQVHHHSLMPCCCAASGGRERKKIFCLFCSVLRRRRSTEGRERASRKPE